MPADASGPHVVREIVLDHEGVLSSVRGVDADDATGNLADLVAIARRAGRLAGQHELSFYWRDGEGVPLFCTIRTLGHESRTSLSWTSQVMVPYGITPRELDVLTLLVGGLSNNAIAERLWTSARTVTTHVERILAKLDVRSRAGAAAVAIEESLLVLPVPGGPKGFERLLIGLLSTPEEEADPVQPWRRHGLGRTVARPAAPATGRRSVRRPILLGSAFPVTGKVAEDGKEMVRASQLAIDELNVQGGIAGRPVELVNVDLDIRDAASISHAFEDLAGQDVDAMVSGYLGDQELAHEIAAEHRAPYLHAATLDSMVRMVEENPSRYGNIFQICPSDTHYGPGFVDALSHLRDSGQLPRRSKSLAVVRGRWKLGDLGLDESVARAERDGWELDYIADDVSGDEAWAEQGRRIASRAPAAVLVGTYFVDETVTFLRSFLAAPSPTVVYSLYAPSIPRFRVEMGPQAEGLLWATTTGTYSDRLARSFGDRYRDAWAVSPGRSHAGIAYDRVRILANAWAAADSPRDFDSVAQSLRQGVHRGVNGAYSFSGAGQSALAYPLVTADPSISMAHLVFQIQDNRQRIVHPSPYTEATFRMPPWWRD
ncbi:ABC transporter substrate-binding protein [Nocardioides sp. cx-169]|uniref:ABC transporter substrate-binding protein n=1 Tax=Nocardioides sp. cx-169 TaxID=2899080 RepID=UPI001E5FFC85|nr:ABC transporter substrate-binding protein [Nocardioides sp. cx-169]MCD4534067.1 ABC transporter substrate-binding protein [Nocardioides sp. cx-169]